MLSGVFLDPFGQFLPLGGKGGLLEVQAPLGRQDLLANEILDQVPDLGLKTAYFIQYIPLSDTFVAGVEVGEGHQEALGGTLAQAGHRPGRQQSHWV